MDMEKYKGLFIGAILMLIGLYALFVIHAGIYVEIGAGIFIIAGVLMFTANIKNIQYLMDDIRLMINGR